MIQLLQDVLVTLFIILGILMTCTAICGVIMACFLMLKEQFGGKPHHDDIDPVGTYTASPYKKPTAFDEEIIGREYIRRKTGDNL